MSRRKANPITPRKYLNQMYAYHRKLRAEGTCVWCRKSHTCGSYLCPKCKKRFLDHVKEVYVARLAKGLCRQCGIGKLVTKNHCELCRLKANRQRRKTLKKWRQLELCLRCGGTRDGTQVYCTNCREIIIKMKRRQDDERERLTGYRSSVASLVWQKKNQQKLLKQGICIWCKKLKDGNYLRHCNACAKKVLAATNRLRRHRIEHKLCVHCGADELSTSRLCEVCRQKDRARDKRVSA